MKALKKAKEFYLANERTILVSAVVFATTLAVLEQFGIQSQNKFLAEHNLLEEYYRPE